MQSLSNRQNNYNKRTKSYEHKWLWGVDKKVIVPPTNRRLQE